jgi:hypothetical protein
VLDCLGVTTIIGTTVVKAIVVKAAVDETTIVGTTAIKAIVVKAAVDETLVVEGTVVKAAVVKAAAVKAAINRVGGVRTYAAATQRGCNCGGCCGGSSNVARVRWVVDHMLVVALLLQTGLLDRVLSPSRTCRFCVAAAAGSFAVLEQVASWLILYTAATATRTAGGLTGAVATARASAAIASTAGLQAATARNAAGGIVTTAGC